jgi:gas vesicle protein
MTFQENKELNELRCKLFISKTVIDTLKKDYELLNKKYEECKNSLDDTQKQLYELKKYCCSCKNVNNEDTLKEEIKQEYTDIAEDYHNYKNKYYNKIESNIEDNLIFKELKEQNKLLKKQIKN